MNPDPLVLVSAFLDGETTDTAELAAALAAPGAREALVDFVLIRAEAGEDRSTPSARFYTAMEQELRRGPIPRVRPRFRRASFAVAAVLLVGLGVAIGFAIQGRRSGSLEPHAPPEATREVRFTEGVDWFRS